MGFEKQNETIQLQLFHTSETDYLYINGATNEQLIGSIVLDSLQEKPVAFDKNADIDQAIKNALATELFTTRGHRQKLNLL